MTEHEYAHLEKRNGRSFTEAEKKWPLDTRARRYFGYTRFPARLFGKRNGQRAISQAELQFYSTRRKAIYPKYSGVTVNVQPVEMRGRVSGYVISGFFT